jgi:hypothetical protein
MRYAKAFAVLATIFALIEALNRVRPFLVGYIGLPMPNPYYVRGPELVLLFGVAASLNFAVLYYAGSRFLHIIWNRGISIFHLSSFLVFGIFFLAAFSVPARLFTSDVSSERIRWLVLPAFFGMLSLVLTLLAFGVNLSIAAAQVLRTRFAKQ